MAELVDALVSNTNAARRAGSTPALGTENPFRSDSEGVFDFLGKLLANISKNQISVVWRNQIFVRNTFAETRLEKFDCGLVSGMRVTDR